MATGIKDHEAVNTLSYPGDLFKYKRTSYASTGACGGVAHEGETPQVTPRPATEEQLHLLSFFSAVEIMYYQSYIILYKQKPIEMWCNVQPKNKKVAEKIVNPF